MHHFQNRITFLNTIIQNKVEVIKEAVTRKHLKLKFKTIREDMKT